MAEKKHNNLLKYTIASGLGAMVAFLIMWWQGIFVSPDLQTVFQRISDGFFVVGVLYVGFGLMFLIAGEGILDILGYGFKSLVYLFTPRRLNRDSGGYYEYKQKKYEERKKKGVPTYLLWIGIAFILIAVACFIAYSNC
jgi:hypothetical protein